MTSRPQQRTRAWSVPQANRYTGPGVADDIRFRCCRRSQTRTVRSSLPVTATGTPSSTVQATAYTQLSWPVRADSAAPVRRSQTRTVPSSLPVTATGTPSRSVQATAYTQPWWPVRVDSAAPVRTCLLYTSDAADEEDSVDLGGR